MKKGQNVGDVMGLVKKKIALIHFNSPFPTLTLTNHVPILKFMGTCGHHFTLHLELWQGQSQNANVKKTITVLEKARKANV
jgi:hypothetical protein